MLVEIGNTAKLRDETEQHEKTKSVPAHAHAYDLHTRIDTPQGTTDHGEHRSTPRGTGG